MTIWRWVFKIALQIIPMLLGLDWSRPRPGELLNYKPFMPKKRRNPWRSFFD